MINQYSYWIYLWIIFAFKTGSINLVHFHLFAVHYHAQFDSVTYYKLNLNSKQYFHDLMRNITYLVLVIEDTFGFSHKRKQLWFWSKENTLGFDHKMIQKYGFGILQTAHS